MNKVKGNEIIKTITASVLAIGIFSTTFIGVNNLVFASAANKTETVPPVRSSVNVSVAKVELPENYKKPSLTVYESAESHKKSKSTLSKQEAADIGALYIWEMFGENIDGKVVEMSYMAYPSNTRTWWCGNVYNSKSDMETVEYIYFFIIDAVTGERIDITKWVEAKSNKKNEKPITFEQVDQLQETYKDKDFKEYIPVVKEYAQKHFSNSKVVSAVYDSMMPTLIRGKDKNTMTYNPKDNEISFIVTDDTGREAVVRIVEETKQLISIGTQENDVVPGFDAYDPGSLG